ncbi:MAG: hypothetical protein GY867_11300, partial [bacterium]|nr:hypothetical protein [bacterium]
MKAIYRGTFGQTGGSDSGYWQKIFYDDAGNVEEISTSFGSRSVALYDEADRLIRSLSGGKAGGAGAEFREVAKGTCADWRGEEGWPSTGALTEKAYDAAGHLILERRCQDHITEQGVIAPRWVETRYKYNAREQIYEISQNHLASP